MKPYKAQSIEKKWQKYWEEHGTYRQYDRPKKQYILDMFPYPSGAGLHVGHPKGYIASDVYARFKQLEGYGVLHPMGWDAFGLPAEQYAIKNNVHPEIAVKENIATFKKQLEKIGFTYDWQREINTTDPQYYKWTQWIFLQMWRKGLAYQSFDPINWCPSCQTGLANEDLEQGRCERCDSLVEKRPMRQWVLKITDYADKMLQDLTDLEWPEGVKEAQRNWIGRSVGTTVQFPITKIQDTNKSQDPNSKFQNKSENLKAENEYIEVFTTRVDTIYGCTYVVISPEHPLIANLTKCHSREVGNPGPTSFLDSRVKPENDKAESISNLKEVEEYLKATKKKTDLERTELNKDKTGVKLEGVEAINPFTGEAVPIFVADYVLGNYGTGAVMAVPAHDERDFEFAKKYKLPIKSSIAPYIEMQGECIPRKDKQTTSKDCVTAITFNPSGKKVLILRRKKGGTCVFPGGGIEKDETAEEAIAREIREETGYKNFSIEKILIPALYGHGFKPTKDVNCFDKDVVFVIRLQNEERDELSEEEHDTHEMFWESVDRVKNIPQLGTHHAFMWEFFEEEKAYTEDGIVFDSGEYTGLASAEAREKMTAWLEAKGLGGKKVNYKMRDWVFSRQRYWGEPIPIIHCDACGVVPVPEEDLPVELPKVESYKPTGNGESPLSAIASWVNVSCPKCGGPAKRETNTMPQWAGSSWYYLRFIEPDNTKAIVDPEKEKKMMPVDVYVGGDHATRHLIYARFWHKFLYDEGIVSTPEPFHRLEFLGLILASDGRKMAKRWGNVINPDDVIGDFGADAFRLYEMFMGPFTQNIAWNTDGVIGTRRFLEKVWKLQERMTNDELRISNKKLESLLHQTIQKVTEDIEGFKFNTAISSLMILVNAMEKEIHIPYSTFHILLTLLSPFAPHIAEEIWENMGNTESIFLEKWPEYDEKLLLEEISTVVVQVNGKVRANVQLPTGSTEEVVKEAAMADANVQAHIAGKEIHKVIFVPDKILNLVV